MPGTANVRQREEGAGHLSFLSVPLEKGRWGTGGFLIN